MLVVRLLKFCILSNNTKNVCQDEKLKKDGILGYIVMRLLGKVMNVSEPDKVIVKAREVPEIGAEVYDENMRVVGYVQDVMGPVKGPYISVKIYKNKINSLSYIKNKSLYWKGFSRRKARKRR